MRQAVSVVLCGVVNVDGDIAPECSVCCGEDVVHVVSFPSEMLRFSAAPDSTVLLKFDSIFGDIQFPVASLPCGTLRTFVSIPERENTAVFSTTLQQDGTSCDPQICVVVSRTKEATSLPRASQDRAFACRRCCGLSLARMFSVWKSVSSVYSIRNKSVETLRKLAERRSRRSLASSAFFYWSRAAAAGHQARHLGLRLAESRCRSQRHGDLRLLVSRWSHASSVLRHQAEKLQLQRHERKLVPAILHHGFHIEDAAQKQLVLALWRRECKRADAGTIQGKVVERGSASDRGAALTPRQKQAATECGSGRSTVRPVPVTRNFSAPGFTLRSGGRAVSTVSDATFVSEASRHLEDRLMGLERRLQRAESALHSSPATRSSPTTPEVSRGPRPRSAPAREKTRHSQSLLRNVKDRPTICVASPQAPVVKVLLGQTPPGVWDSTGRPPPRVLPSQLQPTTPQAPPSSSIRSATLLVSPSTPVLHSSHTLRQPSGPHPANGVNPRYSVVSLS